MVGLSLQSLPFLLILSLSILVSSRPLEPKACVFNLTASIQQSNQILSFNPEAFARRLQEQGSNSSVLSLKLYSLDSQSPPSYGDLTQLRIQREKVRMNFLYNKFNQAIQGNSNSSSTSFFTPTDLQAPIVSGSSLGVGEYFAQIGFGTPSKQVNVVIDTGSDVTWIPCSSSNFDPSTSSSYKPLTCDATLCQQLENNGRCRAGKICQYGVRYLDQRSTGGDFATDTLQFGDSVIPDFPFGCDAQTSGSFGVLGLGRGALSLPSLQKASSFSYCLLDRDSTDASTLEVGSVTIPSGAVTARLLKNPKLENIYYVGLTGISVGGERLQIPASAFEIDQSSGKGGVVIDSGATVSYFTPQVYNSLRDTFVKGVTGLLPPAQEVDGNEICYQLTPELSNLPVIDFHFGEQRLSLSSKSYLWRPTAGFHCLAFLPSSVPFAIIGNTQQQELLVTYDLGRSLIGFSPKPNCQG